MPRVLDRATRAFLARHRVAHFATADAAGAPHVVPLCYALLGPSVYFVVDDKPKHPGGHALKRMRNLAENPVVALVVDDYDEDWTRLAFLLLRGRAEVVADATERRRALRALRTRYPQYRAMTLDEPTHPVVRITPGHAHLWQAARVRRPTAAHRRDAGGRSARLGASGDRRTLPPPQSRSRRR